MNGIKKMNKAMLSSFIEKTFLAGRIEAAMWVSDGKEVSVDFITESGNIVGMLVSDKLALPEGEYPLHDFGVFRSLLNVLDDEITLTPINVKGSGKLIGFVFRDKTSKVEFYLSEKDRVPKIPAEAKSLPPFELEMDLDQKFYTLLTKAISAVKDQELVTVISDGTNARVVIGYNGPNIASNSVSIDITTTKNDIVPPASFLAKDLRDILAANKEMKSGVLRVSKLGIIEMTFDIENYTKSRYFMFKIKES